MKKSYHSMVVPARLIAPIFQAESLRERPPSRMGPSGLRLCRAGVDSGIVAPALCGQGDGTTARLCTAQQLRAGWGTGRVSGLPGGEDKSRVAVLGALVGALAVVAAPADVG